MLDWLTVWSLNGALGGGGGRRLTKGRSLDRAMDGFAVLQRIKLSFGTLCRTCATLLLTQQQYRTPTKPPKCFI